MAIDVQSQMSGSSIKMPAEVNDTRHTICSVQMLTIEMTIFGDLDRQQFMR